MAEPLIVEERDTTLELTLNRPECRNALSRELIARLAEALRAAAAQDRVRCVILTGAPPAFCAGLDLQEVFAETAEGATEHPPCDATALAALYELLAGYPCPVIAAVNGHATAGGAGLVCACDIAVCAASARLSYPGLQRGLVAPVIMPGLVRVVGLRRAQHLLLTGEALSAAQALTWGLVTEVVPDGDALPRARGLAARLATFSPSAVAETRAWLARLKGPGLPSAEWASVFRVE